MKRFVLRERALRCDRKINKNKGLLKRKGYYASNNKYIINISKIAQNERKRIKEFFIRAHCCRDTIVRDE